MITSPLQLLPLDPAGWVNRYQQAVIDYLQEENRVLRAQLRGKRLTLSDNEQRRLALRATSPKLKACAERFDLSIRRGCLDRILPLSERHLRIAVTEYIVHYHTERNHQGLDNELITPLQPTAGDAVRIMSRERLGGVLKYYYRAA